MATTIYLNTLPTGLTLTCDLYPRDSDTASQSAVSLTENTNKKTVYSGSFTVPANAFYDLIIKSGTTIIAASRVYAETTGTFYADDASTVIDEATGSELTVVPAAAPSVREMLAFLYQMARNAQVQSGNSQTVSKADGTVIGTATVTDSGTELVKAKYS